MPTNSPTTQDTHASEAEEPTKCHLLKNQTSTNNVLASQSRKSELKQSQNEKRPDQSPSSSSANPRILRPTTSRGVEHHLFHLPQLEARNTAQVHCKQPTPYSPLKRWEKESAQEEPWSTNSRIYAGIRERNYEVHAKINYAAWKDDSCVRVERISATNPTSSELEDHLDGELGAKLDRSCEEEEIADPILITEKVIDVVRREGPAWVDEVDLPGYTRDEVLRPANITRDCL